MSDELAPHIEELKEVFGAVAKATAPSGEIFVRFERVRFPAGCAPLDTAALLIVKDTARPQFFVKPGVTLPNGAAPKSTSVVQHQGEAWLQFSFSFPWEWNTHTLVQFVGASLRRFAMRE